jgi:hypothetical protein
MRRQISIYQLKTQLKRRDKKIHRLKSDTHNLKAVLKNSFKQQKKFQKYHYKVKGALTVSLKKIEKILKQIKENF